MPVSEPGIEIGNDLETIVIKNLDPDASYQLQVSNSLESDWEILETIESPPEEEISISGKLTAKSSFYRLQYTEKVKKLSLTKNL